MYCDCRGSCNLDGGSSWRCRYRIVLIAGGKSYDTSSYLICNACLIKCQLIELKKSFEYGVFYFGNTQSSGNPARPYQAKWYNLEPWPRTSVLFS